MVYVGVQSSMGIREVRRTRRKNTNKNLFFLIFLVFWKPKTMLISRNYIAIKGNQVELASVNYITISLLVLHIVL